MTGKKKLMVWVSAARPQTLPAAFTPVLIGATLAYQNAALNWAVSFAALLCAFLIQIGTNFANDYFDHQKGADTDQRIGFERATAAGHVTQRQMLNATILTMALAFFCGLFLVWHAGWVILIIGICCLVFGILYTGGPYPLGYNGLGDLFVFLFFGIIAVTTTYYVNAREWSLPSFWASLIPGALAVNILVVNNLRDLEQDKLARKNTLGVLFGEQTLRWEYIIMLLIAFAVPAHFYFQLDYEVTVFLPYLTLPLAFLLIRQVWQAPKPQLNNTLKITGIYMLLFGFLFCIGVAL